MTGVDVEHTKAESDHLIRHYTMAHKMGASHPDAVTTASRTINELRRLVAAVERVQALHTPINAADYGVCNRGAITQVCTGCGQDDGNWQYWPCPTIRALETL